MGGHCAYKQPNKHPMGCEAQLASKCLFMPTFWCTILTPKVAQADVIFGVQSGSLVGLCLQDYKSLVLRLRFVLLWLISGQTHTD